MNWDYKLRRNSMKITYIQTGGTIDKDYPSGETDHGYEFQITDPAVGDIIPRVNAMFEYEIVSLLKKDSLDIDDEDRALIFAKVNSLDNDKIVITHGTDTILQTAEILSPINGKTIVITGAMLPDKFTTSDAKFNIGMATAGVQTLKHGIYVALYGKIVPYNEFKEVSDKFERRKGNTKLQGTDMEVGN